MNRAASCLNCKVALALAVWFAVALAAGALGFIARLRPPLPQCVLFGLFFTLLACRRIPSFRAWLAAIPLSWLLAVHLVRFVGIEFLRLHGRGELPYAFGFIGGWGDIVLAVLTVVLLIVRPVSPRPYLLWSVIGLADMFFVVLSASRAALLDASSMAPLLRLPLSLLPTFFVPLVLFTHVVVLLRLRRGLLRGLPQA
jgi:hypothetical protein